MQYLGSDPFPSVSKLDQGIPMSLARHLFNLERKH
jgi:hypothetical protein